MLFRILRAVKRTLSKEQPSILSASASMMFLMLFAKILGLATKTIAVSQLGTEKYGIFIAANTVPEILSTLLIFGTITSVIIPILVEVRQKEGHKAFERLFNSIVNSGLIAFTLAAVLVAVTADKVTPFVIEKTNPVTPFTTEQISQITDMMRWLLIPQIILGVSSFLSSTLNVFKRFIIPQIAPIFYNLGILFGVTVLIPLLDGSSWGITWGVLIGSILHLAIQIPLGLHLNIRYRPMIDIYSKKLREAIVIGLPRIISLAADQIAIGVDRFIAIGLGAAPLGAYHLAVSMVSIPFSLFSNTFSVAALPHLSEEFAKNDYGNFKNIFSRVFQQILFLTVPVAMVLLVLRLPLVRLLYGIFGGEFSWQNTLMVAWVTFFFTIGLIPEVLNVFLNRAFYSIHDTVRPLFIGLFTVVGGIVTGILFTNYFSHFPDFSLKILRWEPDYFLTKGDGVAAVGGLALSSSLIYTLSFVFLLFLLIRRVGNFSIKTFWLPMLKKVLFGMVMAVLMYFLFRSWDVVLDTAKTINVLILTVSTVVPGYSIYLWLLYISKDKEIELVEKLVKYLRKLLKV